MNPATWNGFTEELAEIHGLEKQALLKRLFGLAEEVPQAAKKFVPSFQGHTKTIEKAVGKRLAVDPRGIEQASHWNPMTQEIHRTHAVTGVPGWTG